MSKFMKRIIAVVAAFALVLTVIPENVEAKAEKSASTKITVASQSELTAALKSGENTKITVKTDKKVTITASGRYDSSKVKLVIDAPKANIKNKGTFKSITILKAKKYYEYASDNSIAIKDESLTMKVTESSRVRKLTAAVKGKVKLVNDGSISKLYVSAPAELVISGDSTGKVPVVIKKDGAGSSVSSELPLKLSAYGDVDLTLKKGAESSSVVMKDEAAEIRLDNNTSKTVTVKDSDGTEVKVKKDKEFVSEGFEEKYPEPTTAPTISDEPQSTKEPEATPAPTGTDAEPTGTAVTPTVAPTVTPTVAPTVTPTVAPTGTPTAAPTGTPTVAPTVTPTAAPTGTPTAAPTVTPTVAPTVTPTVAPTGTPEPTPTCTHSNCEYIDGNAHKCKDCKETLNHNCVEYDDSCHICGECSSNMPHNYVDGFCGTCGHTCTHNGKTAGQTCDYCHLTVPCSMDHTLLCPGQTCSCGARGTGSHSWSNGECSKCGERCNHPGYNSFSSSEHKCVICDVTGAHDYCVEVDDELHKCSVCGDPAQHEYINGNECDTCHHACTHNGKTAGQTCDYCHLTVPCSMDHTLLCPGQTCSCGARGTGSHSWSNGECSKCGERCNHPGYNSFSSSEHKCVICDVTGAHDYSVEVDDELHKCSVCENPSRHEYIDGKCNTCHHTCTHNGKTAGQTCDYCHLTVQCSMDHTLLCPGQTCSCGAHGTGSHSWSNGVCRECGEQCNHPGYEESSSSEHKCVICDVKKAHNYSGEDDIRHVCSVCKAGQRHDYSNGKCNTCHHTCTHSGESEGEKCKICNTQVPYTCTEDHFTFCPGKICTICGKPGTRSHSWSNGECSECGEQCNHPGYKRDSSSEHKCVICDVTGAHAYSVEVDDWVHKCSVCENQALHEYINGNECNTCHHTCTHSGFSAGETCTCCHREVP